MITYSSPVQLVFHPGCFEQKLELFDSPEVLVLMSLHFSQKNKSLEKLSHAKVEILHGECTEKTLHDLAHKYQASLFTTIVGVGGGSVLDAAKSLRALLVTGLDSAFELSQNVNNINIKRKLKLVLAPTTSGTGSECSRAAIVLNEASGQRFAIRGDLATADEAIVDSRLNQSCPLPVKLDCGFDAFAHAVETYISIKSSDYIRQQSVYIIKTLAQNLSNYISDPHNLEAADKVALASMLAGNNLLNSSTCLPHRIQYAVSSQRELTHGRALRLIYPAWLAATAPSHTYFKNLAQDLGVDDFIKYFDKFVANIHFQVALPHKLNQMSCEKIVGLVNGNLTDDPGYSQKVLEKIIFQTFE